MEPHTDGSTTELMTRAEVAQALSTSVRQVDRWRASGELPTVLLGRRVRVQDTDVRAFIARHHSGRATA